MCYYYLIDNLFFTLLYKKQVIHIGLGSCRLEDSKKRIILNIELIKILLYLHLSNHLIIDKNMNKRNIIIVTISIATSIVCIALTFWGNIKNDGTITTDAFIGIIASLIGVCVTIVVGFQIASFLELREVRKQVEQVEKQRTELEVYKQSVASDLHVAKAGVANAFGILSVVERGTLLGFAARVSSIICDNLHSTPGDILLTRYQQLNSETSNFLQTDDYIETIYPIINNLKYLDMPKCKERYNEIMKLHFEIISLVENARQTVDNKVE